jgi:aryl-alcohol dehydrogenase-like predicted oxidoreductase
MKQNRLGKTGLVVSEIGMGTMTFGTMADEAQSLAILDKAFAAGVTFLDTAEMYPVPPNAEYAGRTEEICGKWMKNRPRDSVIVASKVAGPGGGWFLGPLRSGHTGLDRHNIERAVEESLRRLGTDYIDLYQTHWPDPDYAIDDTLEALDRVVEEGKVRYIGCSNQSAYGLTKSLWASDRNGTGRYETIQNNFSLVNRRFEDELAEVCRREQVSLLPYSPIAGGVLSGKYQNDNWPEGARFSLYRKDPARGAAMTGRFINERSQASIDRFTAIADDCGHSLTTFATAWTLSRDFVASTLIGATTVEQLDDTLAAAGVVLSAETLAACDVVSREIPYPLG